MKGGEGGRLRRQNTRQEAENDRYRSEKGGMQRVNSLGEKNAGTQPVMPFCLFALPFLFAFALRELRKGWGGWKFPKGRHKPQHDHNHSHHHNSHKHKQHRATKVSGSAPAKGPQRQGMVKLLCKRESVGQIEPPIASPSPNQLAYRRHKSNVQNTTDKIA